MCVLALHVCRIATIYDAPCIDNTNTLLNYVFDWDYAPVETAVSDEGCGEGGRFASALTFSQLRYASVAGLTFSTPDAPPAGAAATASALMGSGTTPRRRRNSGTNADRLTTKRERETMPVRGREDEYDGDAGSSNKRSGMKDAVRV